MFASFDATSLARLSKLSFAFLMAFTSASISPLLNSMPKLVLYFFSRGRQVWSTAESGRARPPIRPFDLRYSGNDVTPWSAVSAYTIGFPPTSTFSESMNHPMYRSSRRIWSCSSRESGP